MSEHSWSDLEKPQAQPPVNDRFNEVCALVFSAGPGKELLGLLRKKYFDTPENLLGEDRALRVRATQMQFVRELETACERGSAALANRKPKAV